MLSLSPRKIANIHIYLYLDEKHKPHTGTWHKYRINYKHVLSTGMFVDVPNSPVHHIKKTHSLQRRNPQLRNGMPRPILRKLLLEDRRRFFFDLNKFLSNSHQFFTQKHAKSPCEEHQRLDFLSPWPKFVGDPASHHPHHLENMRSETQSLKILFGIHSEASDSCLISLYDSIKTP